MELNNKKAMVVGLGKSGIAVAQFLREQGALVTACDAKDITVELPGITVQTGAAQWSGLEKQQLIVISPGVPVQTRGAGARADIKHSCDR